MSHLSDRLAEFVFGELSTSETAEAHRHLAECSDCRDQVGQFQKMHAMLKASPDVEPPRRMVFEVEKPQFAPWLWRWLAPMVASAAVAWAVVAIAPRPQPVVERVVVQQQVPQPVAQPIDYEEIISKIRASQEGWLANELRRHDAAQVKEIERVRGELALVDGLQRSMWKETIENASSIQLLAQKSGSQD